MRPTARSGEPQAWRTLGARAARNQEEWRRNERSGQPRRRRTSARSWPSSSRRLRPRVRIRRSARRSADGFSPSATSGSSSTSAAKSEGRIAAAELKDAEGNLTVKEGETLEATVTGADPETGALLLKRRAGGKGKRSADVVPEIRQAYEAGLPVEGTVTGINKGGAEVQVAGMRAFCPLSQLDLRYVEDPQKFVGQKLAFRVSRLEEGNRGGRGPNIVLSRRALLEEEQQSRAAETRAEAPGGRHPSGQGHVADHLRRLRRPGRHRGHAPRLRDRPHPHDPSAGRLPGRPGGRGPGHQDREGQGREAARAHLPLPPRSGEGSLEGRRRPLPRGHGDHRPGDAPGDVRRLRRAGAGPRGPGPHQRDRGRPAAEPRPRGRAGSARTCR